MSDIAQHRGEQRRAEARRWRRRFAWSLAALLVSSGGLAAPELRMWHTGLVGACFGWREVTYVDPVWAAGIPGWGTATILCAVACFLSGCAFVRTSRGLNRWARRHCDCCGTSLVGVVSSRCSACGSEFDASSKITDADDPNQPSHANDADLAEPTAVRQRRPIDAGREPFMPRAIRLWCRIAIYQVAVLLPLSVLALADSFVAWLEVLVGTLAIVLLNCVIFGFPASVVMFLCTKFDPDAGVCMACGYPLGDLKHPRCPECGTAVEDGEHADPIELGAPARAASASPDASV